ncbi:hypothetical protein [Streptomyces flavidovirens]|uniref:hypothetical protein n=1 Tax=Streptomyces flavidovirens TaxID=67298 RepID=UPI00042855F1|nr:hypothetical protein [Streptomyces flavidovirens]
MTARKTPAAGSFDAFWATVSGGKTETIRGVTVTIPTDVPLAMEMRISELRESSAEQDIRELLGMLFGADHLDAWRDAGMGLTELQTVLAWGMAHASGKPLTFAEAYEAVMSAQGEGKAPSGQNRAARRKPSASTGGRSARTSAASTASARKSSRA